MNLETLIDDLEAQFDADARKRITTSKAIQDARRLRIWIDDEANFSLVAPILGLDFIAGFDERTADWICLIQCNVSRMQFEASQDLELPKLRRQKVTVEEFITCMPLPAAVVLGNKNGEQIRASAIDANGDLLFLRPQKAALAEAVSFSSLNWFRLIEFADRCDLQEWSNK